MRQCLARLTAFALDFAHFEIGGSYWVRRPVLVGLAVGIHDAEIVFCVLIQIFGRNPVTARRRFAGERDVTFEDLVGVAPDFYVRTVAVESLDPMRHPWTAMVRVITVVATARAFVWSWSHDTCLIAVDIIGLCPAGKVPLAPLRRPQADLPSPTASSPRVGPTLDGTAEYSNHFLPSIDSDPPRPSDYATGGTGEIFLDSAEHKPTGLQHAGNHVNLAFADLGNKDSIRCQQPWKVCSYHSVRGKTLVATIEGQPGIITGDFARQQG